MPCFEDNVSERVQLRVNGAISFKQREDRGEGWGVCLHR